MQYVIHTAYVFSVENSFWNSESTLMQYLLIFHLFLREGADLIPVLKYRVTDFSEVFKTCADPEEKWQLSPWTIISLDQNGFMNKTRYK